MMYKIVTYTLVAGVLAGCGGGGGGSDSTGMPVQRVGPSQTYLTIDATNDGATSQSGGAILNGLSVSDANGSIQHNAQTFVASGGVTGDLGDTSKFSFSDYEYATDVEVSASQIAIVGVSTAIADVRTSGTATYSGEFRGELGQSSTITALNWSADVQVGFAGSGDIDMTFAGGGSAVIDTIRINNARISGNTFSGGTISTSNGGSNNNVTGTSVDMDGAFFGYDEALNIPAEVGGAIASSDSDTTLLGVFIASSQP